MSESFTKDRVDFGFSKVPNGLWTADLSHGAKCLLGWLWSHDDEYLAKLSVRRIGTEFGGGGQVVEWLRNLEAKGYLTKTKDGDRYVVHLVGAAWKALTVRKPNPPTRSETERDRDGNRTVTATETEHREEQGEDQEKTIPPKPPKGGRHRRKDPHTPDDDPGFNRAWEAYGRYGGKKEARLAWDDVGGLDDIENIVRGAEQWRAYREATPELRHKYMQGWLSGERWRHPPPPVPVSNGDVMTRAKAALAARRQEQGDQT